MSGPDATFNNGQPLGVPSVRAWELNDDTASSRYDSILAAPSDEHLRIMWTVYSIFFTIFTILLSVVFLAIVTNRKVRRNSFNLYLIFLMIPDLVFTGFCAINCAWLAANNGYRYEWVCSFQSFYLMYGMGANAWLNGIIAYEVHTMLRVSHAGHRYQPPPRRVVIRNALLVYAWAAFVALWGVVSLPWLPHTTNAQNGFICTPVEFNAPSTVFFWVVYMPALSIIPILYCVAVSIRVVRRNLLPPSGKRRALAIYFFRIVTLFVVMWSPWWIAFYVTGGAYGHPWVVWATGLWGHFQGPVSAGISCLKVDIRKAVVRFWKRMLSCGCCSPEQENADLYATGQEKDEDNYDSGHSRHFGLQGPTAEANKNSERLSESTTTSWSMTTSWSSTLTQSLRRLPTATSSFSNSIRRLSSKTAEGGEDEENTTDPAADIENPPIVAVPIRGAAETSVHNDHEEEKVDVSNDRQEPNAEE